MPRALPCPSTASCPLSGLGAGSIVQRRDRHKVRRKPPDFPADRRRFFPRGCRQEVVKDPYGCSTGVLHRQNPTVLEMTDFEGLFRCRKSVAEREGFEPPIGLHLCRISSAVHSTTLPPLQAPLTGGLRRGRASSRRGRRGRQGAGREKFLGAVRRLLKKGGTARRDKNRRSRVASLKLWPGSAASLANLSDGLTVAIRA